MNNTDTVAENYIRRKYCAVCGSEGVVIHNGLKDRLFSIAGAWSMSHCVNSNCDLHWLDPMPTTAILPSFYVNYHTHTPEPVGGRAKRLYTEAVNSYLSSEFGYENNQKSMSSILGKWLIRAIPTLKDDAAARVYWLDAYPGGRLLEIGFGNGATLARLKRLGWSVAGVEFDPVSVELANQLGIDARLGSLEDCKFEDASFDAVVSSHLLEHLPDPRTYIRECFRILHPGGKLILTTPNAASRGHRLFGANWRGLEPPRHLHIFGPKALQSLVEEAGFCKVKISCPARGGHIFSQSLRFAFGFDPSARRRIEVESMAIISWLLSVMGGAIKGEELRLECER